MKHLNNNIELTEKESKELFFNNLKIRKINMKTRILFSSLLTVIFLVAFSGCSILKTGAKSGTLGRWVTTTDSNNMPEEQVVYDNAEFTNPGKTAGFNRNYQQNSDNNIEYKTVGNTDNNQNYEEEELLNEGPISSDEDADLETFENNLSDDGKFVNVTKEEIDPDNNVSTETTNIDVDVYTNVIWIPNTSYVSAGWNPYTNGRWVWTRYGWTWKSYYHWGWATYHYGRWWYSSRYGWVWSPGRRWAPGWVVWGHHNNYEGWHPISPRVRHHNGIISPIMPRPFNNNGWVVVKKEDFNKKVNSSTVVTGKTKNDVIKNSTTSITLKQEGKKLINTGLVTTKNENTQVKNNEINKINQVTTKQKQEINNGTKTVNNVNKKEINSTGTKTNETINKKQNNSFESNTQVTTRKQEKQLNVQKNKNTEEKNILNETKKPVSINKNNLTGTTEQNSSTRETPKKVTEKNSTTQTKKENNSVNVNKNSSNENKTVIRETQKKVTETKQPVYEEKKKVENNYSNSNNNTVTKKTENTNKTVVIEKKEEKSPKVNVTKETNTQQKNSNKKESR